MSCFIYLLIVVWCCWQTDASSIATTENQTHRASEVSRLVPYVGVSDKTVVNVKAEICYCIGSTCYYCPGNTYCTVDRKGCCPRPGCRNSCDRWCLCPSFPICCRDGACQEDHPKCCGNVCCEKTAKCCEGEENHCCEEGTSCCGYGCCAKKNGKCCTSSKTKEKLCCVKKDSKIQEKSKKETDNDESVNWKMLKADEAIFKYLCEKFENFLPKRKPQYAILVVGRLSNKYYLDPEPEAFNKEGLAIGKNYAAAYFMGKGKEHTEYRILAYADDMINSYIAKYQTKPQLFLFSKNSPCCGAPLVQNCANGCAGKINAKLTELKNSMTSMVIAWDQNYKLGPMPFDKALLFSLNSMLSPGNAQLSWATNGYCRVNLKPRGWFQNQMFKCLNEKVQTHPFCSKTRFESDLARLVNKVTWNCGTSSQSKDEYYPKDTLVYDGNDTETLEAVKPARDAKCWKEVVSSIDKAVKCSELANSAYNCAKIHQNEDLGPALAPNNHHTFSNSAADVRGEYGELCFTSGSCRAPDDSQVDRH